MLQACSFFGIPTRPELGWCGEDPAWGTPTASPARAWCIVPWVQSKKSWGADVKSWKRQSNTSLQQTSIAVFLIREIRIPILMVYCIYLRACCACDPVYMHTWIFFLIVFWFAFLSPQWHNWKRSERESILTVVSLKCSHILSHSTELRKTSQWCKF